MEKTLKIILPVTTDVVYTFVTNKKKSEIKRDIEKLGHKIIYAEGYEFQECESIVENEVYNPAGETLFAIDGESVKFS